MGEPASTLLPSSHSPVPERPNGTWLVRSSPRGDVVQLTKGEWHVLAELRGQEQGVATARLVAAAPSVAVATVYQHLLHLYCKLGATPGPERRACLARLAGLFGMAGPLASVPDTLSDGLHVQYSGGWLIWPAGWIRQQRGPFHTARNALDGAGAARHLVGPASPDPAS